MDGTFSSKGKASNLISLCTFLNVSGLEFLDR